MTKIAQQGNSVSHRHRCSSCCWRRSSDRDMVNEQKQNWFRSISRDLRLDWECGGVSLQLYRTYKHVPVTPQANMYTASNRYAWRALLVHFDCLHSIFSHVWRTFSNLRFVFWLLFSVCYFELFLCWCGVFWFHSFLAGLKACTGICTPPNQIPTAYFEKCAIFTHSTKLPATMSEALLHCRFSPITISLLLTFQ